VTTTVAKAKEARPVAEHLITVAKRGDLHARRLTGAYLRSEDVNKKLFDTIAPWYAERPGGYTRITRVGRRLGDAGEIGVLSLIKSEEQIVAEAGTSTEDTAKKRRFPRLGLRRKKAAPTGAASPAAPSRRNSRKEKREAARADAPKRPATRRRKSTHTRTAQG
jgi:large subunit ribosomal protein L17